MAKKCPETGEYVLYVDCLECEMRGNCPGPGENKPWFALLIVGSRGINDYSFVSSKIDKLIAPIRYKYRFLIVTGGARGVDSLAERYASENGMDIYIIPADWNKYGKAAGYIRNEEMHRHIASFEHRGCIAFWDGKSKGTAHSFELAKKYGNTIKLCRWNGSRAES